MSRRHAAEKREVLPDAKYGDVVSSLEALDYVRSVVATGGLSAKAQDDFQRWWSNGSSKVA